MDGDAALSEMRRSTLIRFYLLLKTTNTAMSRHVHAPQIWARPAGVVKMNEAHHGWLSLLLVLK